jgi:hypothetical protein
MKSIKFTFTSLCLAMLFILAGIVSTYGQIQIEGYYADGEGGAGWDADGSGPEPYGNGHNDVFYYLASRNYIDPEFNSGGHCLSGMPGFETFELALADNGFTPDQVTIRLDLASMEDDIMGVDWFNIGPMHYANWFPFSLHIDLDGELMIFGTVNYYISYIGPSTGNNWYMESAYFVARDVSAFSDPAVQLVSQAFMQDMEGYEMKLYMQTEFAGVDLTGDGRNGGYYDMAATLEKGLLELPFTGLNDDHEGFAGWDADGTGPEPYGNGHSTQLYYGASLDYDGIDPHPDACLGHFLEGSTGFFNTLIQLEYRGYEIGDLKIKMGLSSLGPDVQGEDWGYENGHHWCNYYNNDMVIEINGEPILAILHDTNKLVSLPAKWISETRIGKLYDISGNATPEAQFVAQSLLRDVGTHYLKTITDNIQYGTLFSGNGRDGALYEILAGSLRGVHEQATFIPEGPVSGVWDMMGSPYFVDGHLTIDVGQSLNIEPGVKVAVRGPYQINVFGNIMAEGTEEETILFTHSNPNLMWDGFGYNGEFGDTSALSVFDHCIFEHGHALGPNHENSGGMFAVKQHNKMEIYNCTFRHNKATIDGGYPSTGGAIVLWNSSPLIQNCIFYDNFAEYGGAIFSYSYSNPIISNCLFHDNHAIHGGAVSFYDYGNGVLINNTLANNSGEYGGALFFYMHSNPQIINNIIWGNSAVVGNQVYFTSIGPSYPGFYYNDIEGGQEGFYGGSYVEYLFNIDDDPAFVGESFEFPYYLQIGSPCMEAGTPDTSAWYMPEYLPEHCICGSPRFYGEWLDMGAFEWAMSGIDDAQDHGPELLTLFPNPVRGLLFMDFTLEKGSEISIEFYNITGALISKIDLGQLPSGEQLQSWNATGLPEGIYICRLNTGNKVLTAKWVKAN